MKNVLKKLLCLYLSWNGGTNVLGNPSIQESGETGSELCTILTRGTVTKRCAGKGRKSVVDPFSSKALVQRLYGRRRAWSSKSVTCDEPFFNCMSWKSSTASPPRSYLDQRMTRRNLPLLLSGDCIVIIIKITPIKELDELSGSFVRGCSLSVA